MKALKLIIQREYLAAVKTKAFIITTILVPIVMIVCMVLPTLLMKLNNDDINKVYVIDRTDVYFSKLKSSDKYLFSKIENESALPDRNQKSNELYGLLVIDGILNNNPNAATFYSEKQQPPRELIQYINEILTDEVKNKNLNDYTTHANIDTQVVESLQEIINSKDKIHVATKQWREDGQEKDTINDTASFIGMALTFLMFFFIIMNGSLVMQSVVEEKTNKIVEVIVSSTKPFNLMMGKIIAVALMGFTQLVIWAVLLTIGGFAAISILGIDVASMSNMMSMTSGADTQQMMTAFGNLDPNMSKSLVGLLSINWIKVFGCFIIYFIGGYLLYAALFAMFGSAANDSQEAQQFIMPVTIILLLVFYVGFAAARNPEGALAFWGSIIPFTSPIVMMVRLPLEVPIWEIILSIGLLFVTAFGFIYFAGKIYRIGILMTGKKVTFKEIFKWISYK